MPGPGPATAVPTLVLLLPAGFLAGVYLEPVDPEEIFGAAFSPMVDLAVAVILFHEGLEPRWWGQRLLYRFSDDPSGPSPSS